MDLLHKMVSDLNNQVKDKDRICIELGGEVSVLKLEKDKIN